MAYKCPRGPHPSPYLDMGTVKPREPRFTFAPHPCCIHDVGQAIKLLRALAYSSVKWEHTDLRCLRLPGNKIATMLGQQEF